MLHALWIFNQNLTMIQNWQLILTNRNLLQLNLYLYFVTSELQMGFQLVDQKNFNSLFSNVNEMELLHFITINFSVKQLTCFRWTNQLFSVVAEGYCWNMSRESIRNHLENHLTPCWTFGKTSISAISCQIKNLSSLRCDEGRDF